MTSTPKWLQAMDINWNEKDPIYRQLHDRLVEMILEGVYRNGDVLPSVRQISSDHRINPITVSKAFQLLVDEGVVEKKRGLGMYVMTGAREKLTADEKSHFMKEEWPRIVEKIERLGLSVNELLLVGEAK